MERGRSETVAAQRMRRLRACRSGDHSQCSPRTCQALRPEAPLQGGAGPSEGSLAAAVGEMVAALKFEDTDPRRFMATVAVRLAARIDEAPSAALVREFRQVLKDLAEPERPAEVFDAQALHRAWRRFDAVLAGVESDRRTKARGVSTEVA